MADNESKFRWDEWRTENNEAFRQALNKTGVRERLFGEKFIEGLEKRRDALDSRLQKAFLVQLTVSLLLAMALLSPEMSIGIVGLSAKAGTFREILLLILGSLQAYTMMPAIEQSRINDALQVYIEREAAEDVTVLRLLKLRYGLGVDIKMPEFANRAMSKWQKIRLILSVVGFVLWLLTYFAAMFAVELLGAVSILRTPSISLSISIILCVYLVLVTITNIFIRAISGIGARAD